MKDRASSPLRLQVPRLVATGTAGAASRRPAQPMRFQKPRPAGSLKSVLAETVAQLGGLERAGDWIGRSRTQVARFTDPAEADSFPTIDQIRTWEAALGRPLVTTFMALEAGALLLTMPQGEDGAAAVDLAAIGQETAELFRVYGEALRDGSISRGEAGAMVKEIDDVAAALVTARAHLVEIRDEQEEAAS
ncbi:hypothetical protein FRZ44_38300 [Hypericibacter terrae]|uniref:Uncharacterized protein n=1 Tax=Hypericibacter terrae TaxID=2602015 RepID=A0A5J6MMC2_9PROT|nr:hypothetical protein [Hypericibacter terrae]QEX18523.1 hypothetical protein FRZ44_38300 [Hypericibacter terrae]